MAYTPIQLQIGAYKTPPEGGASRIFDRLFTYALNGLNDTRRYTIPSTTFQALTVPTGAQFCLIMIPAGTESLYLKNVTGDSEGIALTSATAANVRETPALIPVAGSSVEIGLLNSGDGSIQVDVYFF
jgi:hypothetical protein